MTKILVQTPDNTQRAGSMANGDDCVAFDRPSVVVLSTYIETQLADGRLVRVYEDDLPEGATDTAWAGAWNEARADAGWEGTDDEIQLTVAAWASELPDEAPAVEAPEPGAGSDAANTSAPKPDDGSQRRNKKTHQAPAEG